MTKTNTTTVWGETYIEDGVSVRAAVRLDFDLTAQYQDEVFCRARCVLSVSSEQCSEEQDFLVRFSLCRFSDQVFWEPVEWDGFGVPDGVSYVNPYDFDPFDAIDVHGSYLRFAIETAIASACEKAESAARDFLRDALENKSDVQIVYESSGFPFWAVYEILLLFINRTATLNNIMLWCLVGVGGYLIRVICFGISTRSVGLLLIYWCL